MEPTNATILLHRGPSTDEGTFGVLNAGEASFYTGEDPWLANAHGISCIPLGTYACKWTLSPRLKIYTYEVLAVPDRDGIRIHSFNFEGDVSKGFDKESSGCISLGLALGKLKNHKGKMQAAVLHSRDAIAKFNGILDKRDFSLKIV